MRAYDWLLLASVLAISIEPLTSKESLPNSAQESRYKRQTRRRPVGFFGQFNQFIRDTVSETGVAYRNISKIFSDQFTTTTPSPNEIEDTNSTTPKAYTMQEVFGILGRNYRGLQRLFNREWRTAIENQSTH
uniref:Uncharacterized protein n=1 Tax=Clastoptera arizonana TaxID=38151 RepID=A0A1B6CB48_9HEMI